MQTVLVKLCTPKTYSSELAMSHTIRTSGPSPAPVAPTVTAGPTAAPVTVPGLSADGNNLWVNISCGPNLHISVVARRDPTTDTVVVAPDVLPPRTDDHMSASPHGCGQSSPPLASDTIKEEDEHVATDPGSSALSSGVAEPPFRAWTELKARQCCECEFCLTRRRYENAAAKRVLARQDERSRSPYFRRSQSLP